MFSERDIVVNDDISIAELNSLTEGMFKKYWCTSHPYTYDTLIKFGSSKLLRGISDSQRTALLLTVQYCAELFYQVYRGTRTGVNLNKLDEFSFNEALHWENEGGICIYVSVLLDSLLSSHPKLNQFTKNYVQGFYRHPLREDFPVEIFPLGKTQMGLHSWIQFNDSVIDLTVGQESSVFNFKDAFYILGDVPEGLELYGHIDNDIVSKYISKFAKQSGLTYNGWVKMHRVYMLDYFYKALKKSTS